MGNLWQNAQTLHNCCSFLHATASSSTITAVSSSLDVGVIGARDINNLGASIRFIFNGELNGLSFSETSKIVIFDLRLVKEEILTGIVRGYESRPLLIIESLQSSTTTSTFLEFSL